MDPSHLRVRCLRRRDYLGDGVLGAQINWYGMLCCDDFDVTAFQEWHQRHHGAPDAAPGFGADRRQDAGSAEDAYQALQEEYYAAAGGAGAGAQEQPTQQQNAADGGAAPAA